MKTMKFLSVIALLVMGAFTFTSCSDDDDNSNGIPYNLTNMTVDEVKAAMVGTWVWTDTGIEYGEPVFETGMVEFKADGTLIAYDYGEPDYPGYWNCVKNSNGFELTGWYNGTITYLTTTTIIVTFDQSYGGESYSKGTVTYKRIK